MSCKSSDLRSLLGQKDRCICNSGWRTCIENKFHSRASLNISWHWLCTWSNQSRNPELCRHLFGNHWMAGRAWYKTFVARLCWHWPLFEQRFLRPWPKGYWFDCELRRKLLAELNTNPDGLNLLQKAPFIKVKEISIFTIVSFLIVFRRLTLTKSFQGLEINQMIDELLK